MEAPELQYMIYIIDHIFPDLYIDALELHIPCIIYSIDHIILYISCILYIPFIKAPELRIPRVPTQVLKVLKGS